MSYRAFAKDYHAKQESIQGFKTNDLYQNQIPKTITDKIIAGSEVAHDEGVIIKARLNQILRQKQYDALEYLTCELDYMVPIALSASITPDYFYKNEILNKSADLHVPYEYVNFVIQPTTTGKTQILLSCLPEHSKSVKFINQLEGLKPLPFIKAICSLAISHVENTFMSPLIWNRLNLSERGQLLKEIYITGPIQRSTSNSFFHSKLNLLDKRFEKIVQVKR